ncbi:MAG: IPT/TIG domain-containing protein [Chitinophagaceae bacterium]|nr:IPT/TIG domain-containing protein [Chitinophagaceae bacterium]
MINKLNIRLLPLVGFILAIVAFASCKKDEDTGTDQITLLSFGPTGAMHGDTLRFFGTNLDKVTEIIFTGTSANIEKAAFIKQNKEEIIVIVPVAAEQGFVTLKTPQGDIVTKTRLNLSVATTVTSMTAQARPGENVTLTGDYLNWVTRVTFADGKNVDTFVSKTRTQLVVKVPSDAQTGRLIINYGGTALIRITTTDTLKVTLPMLTGVSPNPVRHAANLTITGTNMDLTKKIIFTGVATPITTFVSITATQIVVTVPAGARAGKISLVAASGVMTTSTIDLNLVLPSITTMTPNPVSPLSNLTLTGTNLDIVDSITFQNAPAVKVFVSQSATQLVLRVPTGVLNGKIVLAVKNSTVTVESADILQISGNAPPPTMSLPIYNDVVTANWNGWIGGGWGGTSDRNNPTPVREGTKSIRISYVGGYGSPLQLGGASINLATYTTMKISVYGAPGSAGKVITIGINGVNGNYNITVVEGEWTDYSIPISTLTSAASLAEIWVQEFSGTGGFTVYVDAIGLN